MFHVDESADQLHHLHSGVLVDARDAAAASKRLDEIVVQAHLDRLCSWGAELHATDIINKRQSWRGPLEERANVIRQALQVLAAHNIEVISHGAELSAVRKRYGDQFDPYLWEFSNLLERLNERLRARDEYAVVIADHHATHRDRLQQNVIDARTRGTGGYRNQVLDRIVDTAHFVDSRLSRMTQLADLVVYTLRRRRSIPVETDQRAEVIQTELVDLIIAAIPDPRAKYNTIRR